MSDDLKPLDVTTPEDLVKPEKPEVLHGKPVEVPPEPDWQKLGTLTIGESLGRIWNSVTSGIQIAVEVITDIDRIIAGLKWVLILTVVVFVFYLILRYL